jgi:hypothetical protein
MQTKKEKKRKKKQMTQPIGQAPHFRVDNGAK